MCQTSTDEERKICGWISIGGEKVTTYDIGGILI